MIELEQGLVAAMRMLVAKVRESYGCVYVIGNGGSASIASHAAAQMAASGGAVITLSGFSHDNPLRSMGDINIWLNSDDYGLVEIGHQFIA